MGLVSPLLSTWLDPSLLLTAAALLGLVLVGASLARDVKGWSQPKRALFALGLLASVLSAMMVPAIAFAALLVPNVGEAKALEHFLNKSSPENQVLKLYTNNITPAEADTAGTYTEASGNGYASKALTGSSWTVTQGAPSDATYAQQTFAFTGALGNVYGYFVVEATSTVLLWAERFVDGPYNVANNGDEIRVTPKITAD